MPPNFKTIINDYKLSSLNIIKDIDSMDIDQIDDQSLAALVYSFNNLNICGKYEDDFLDNESGTLMSSLVTLISVTNDNPNIVGIIKSETGEDYSDRLVEPLENLVTKVDGGDRQQLQQSIKINEINGKIWSSHRSKILTLTKAVREKATSTVVEEASWLEGFVNEIATDNQISSLIQIHADNNKNLPNVIREIKALINENVTQEMGGLPPFDKDNKFNAKASAGKPDVVMRKPDGSLFFCYANYFVDTRMESDQATRHTAMLLETQRVLNSDKSDRSFWDIYADIKSSDVKTATNEADLWNKILSNPKDYRDLSISISSYQHIDSGSLLDSINKSKDFDLSPNELSDIRMILSSLPILAQDFNNMMPTNKTLGSDMVGDLPFIKAVKLCQPENTDTTVTKTQAETKFKAVIGIFSETKNTLLSIIKGMGINRNIGEGKPSGKGIHYVNSNRNLQKVSTKSSTEYNINNDMLKGSDFITVLMMSIMEKKANYRQALIEAILQIYSDDRAMILSILPRNDDELREFEEFLKSENMISPLSSKDMELNITAQKADENRVEADENRVEADENREELFNLIITAVKTKPVSLLEEWMSIKIIKMKTLEAYIRKEVEKLELKGMDPDYQDIILSEVAIENLNVYLRTQEETDEVHELMAVIETYSEASKKTQGQTKKQCLQDVVLPIAIVT